MADKKPMLTQHVKLPPGVVLTPDHEFPEPASTRPVIADRRIDLHGNPEEIPSHADFGSTYTHPPKQPVAPVDEDRLPRESVNEANAPAERKK